MQSNQVNAVMASLVENKAVITKMVSEECYNTLENQLIHMSEMPEAEMKDRFISSAVNMATSGISMLIDMVREGYDINDPFSQVEYLLQNPSKVDLIVEGLEEQIKASKEIEIPQGYSKHCDRVWNLMGDLKDSFVNIRVTDPSETIQIQTSIHEQLGWKLPA